MADQDTLDSANAYTGAALKAHTDADDPHAYIDPTHGAGYAQMVDETDTPIGKTGAILGAGDAFPDTATTACLFVDGPQAGLYVAGDGGIGWVNIVSNPAPVDTTPPTSPSGLVVSNQTASGFTLTWVGSTDASGIARYETKLDGGPWTSNGTVLSRTFSGLALGDHTVQVRAVDKSAAGNVSTAAQKTITLVSSGGGGGGGGTTKVATVMGVNSDTQGSEYDGMWPGLRVYSTGKVAAAIATGAKYIAFTDEPGISMTGGAASVAKFKTLFDNTWGGPGAPSKNKGVFIAAGNGNEVDINFKNGLAMPAYADTLELLRALTDQYDNASTWIDLTIAQIRLGNSAGLLGSKTTSGKTVGSLCDGMAGSYYPVNEVSKTYGYPTVLSTVYTVAADTASGIVDPFVTLAAQYGITRMAIWETGIVAAINPPPYSGSAGSVYKDANARPNWVKALITYWFDACLSHGMTAEAAFYWDKQTPVSGGGSGTGESGNTNPDVRLQTDSWFTPDPSPTTAGTWFNGPANYNATH